MTRRPLDWLIFVSIGLVAGLLSGLFGVGGGILIVPALVLAARFDPRLASGTSLAAIVPISLIGVVSYAATGNVDWAAALLLAIGAIVGAQIGTHLLAILPRRAIQWGFIGFIAVVVVSLFLVIPSRDASVELNLLSMGALVLTGLVVGVLSGLLGIGGGAVIVPVLILLFGASDLVAKGTSLLVMVPTAISGTFGNARRRNVDIGAAAVIGISACATTALGAIAAAALSPLVANILFAAFLIAVGVQLVVRALKRN
ncbi:sulfite exporter TauE/SafE family protein [Glaciihabitans arcticus]|uniref:Probable membrane transporter protein n=1 Tax=Glaciihabitans arcticus TaxID=2668039 RepID=A0A4Q9GQ97_9MICO|nr:sulfite exporter TauE/SafE family protein [Glaciihabitans arcticus]TBN57026.1 sulfite exporter TauE/SafE family protein [Glaciihabitans arcticus]